MRTGTFDAEEEGTLTAPPVGPGAAPPAKAAGDAEIPPSLRERFEGFTLIGRGGMGAVYRAHDFRLRRDVAIKLLLAGDPGSRSGFLHEARSQARILHPRVCEVFEAGVADHVPFIVMRHVAGGSLDKLGPTIPLEEKARIVRDVAFALHEAHRLGIVHRDVKPGNILVERGEDGAWRAYIADFGIARDPTAGAPEAPSGVQGTPAYMAPEQAEGATGSLDRRTDVYGLGAALYGVLAGRAPFSAPKLGELLALVKATPPVPLRAIKPSTPLDLDAITMRCLEKDPAQRYESARALGEDLQRFLDGDPVIARPRSLGVRLWKKARKNKGRVAAGAVALAVALVVSGLWLRSLRAAAEREALAREMGGTVREMELFLRGAHTLPLHDVEPERDLLRARLRDVEARALAAGDAGIGPGNDAMGRGYLALQDPAAALERFERAEAAGYGARGLDYAIGLASIELHRREREKTSRIQSEVERAARVVEIAALYREPALVRLRAALAQGVESPEYALGLVAHNEGRHEEAFARARAAFAAAPWLYEAKKLEGDVLFAIGSRTRHDKAGFDYGKTTEAFERAAEAYRVAAEIARSDPAVHEAECELWIQAMNADSEQGAPMRAHFDRARRACERAVTASPRTPSGHAKLAWAHLSFAFGVVNGGQARESPEAALAEATSKVEEAAARNPEEAFSRYLVGAVWRSRAMREAQLGMDTGRSLERAALGYEAALAKDPLFLWALNEACGVLAMRGRREAWKGVDPTGTFDLALARCTRASELDRAFLFPAINTFLVHAYDAERLVASGVDPGPVVERGLRAADAAARLPASEPWALVFRAELHRRVAEHAAARGMDPVPALARAREAAARLPASFPAADCTAELDAVTAELLLDTPGGASVAALAEIQAAASRARAAFAAAVAAAPEELGYALWLSRVERVILVVAARSESPEGAKDDAPLAPLRPFLLAGREDPRLFEAAARACEARVELRERLGQKAAGDLREGLTYAGQAVSAAPGLASAHAVFGRLQLLAARAAPASGARPPLANDAARSLATAIERDPLLARTHAPLAAEAERLAQDP